MGALTESIKARFDALRPVLDERSRRLWAGAEAKAIGRGGIARVVESTGISRDTVRTGLKEVQAGVPAVERARGERLRRPGGGRKPLAEHDPELLVALERKLAVLDPVSERTQREPPAARGTAATRDAIAGRWAQAAGRARTCRSAARLAAELRSEGHAVSERSVNRLLHALGYSLQANSKTLEGRQHPDRDAQFQHIYQQVREFQGAGPRLILVRGL